MSDSFLSILTLSVFSSSRGDLSVCLNNLKKTKFRLDLNPESLTMLKTLFKVIESTLYKLHVCFVICAHGKLIKIMKNKLFFSPNLSVNVETEERKVSSLAAVLDLILYSPTQPEPSETSFLSFL